ncbi:MAG: aluminum resistance family protein [Spirulinaceae cyanobacterium SM2_1_0]|nr:aluminum resistance family protein [Spirulinaceae cyanobacterium SM2_1_0]
MNSSELLSEAEKAMFPIFSGIDARVKQNLQKVLGACRDHRLGAHHFATTSGYGHDDLGRDTFERIFAQVMGAEAAIARTQFVSGTHAIACALFGVLRPGDELLAIAGHPYDTLEEVIGLRGSGRGSLLEFGISYRQLELTATGQVDWEALESAVWGKTRVALIQRSCGYSWRPSLAIADIAKIVRRVRAQNPSTICFVDNCYGEFVESLEPPAVGANLIAGSLIKNPGGTLAPAGGYVAGNPELVEAAACRLTAPGIGSSSGPSLGTNRLLFQGLFLAPQMVGEALKGAHLIASVFDRLGYRVNPLPETPRCDTIQAIRLNSADKLVAFCRALQQYSPVGSYLDPVPAPMPGYSSKLVMAGGTFIDGSTAEFSADAPLREPYTVFCQGGTHWTHVAIALAAAIEAVGPA